MKMPCHSTPGAVAPSRHADTEVEVSDQIYRLTITHEMAASYCCEELIGRDLRIMLGDNRHDRSPEWETVTPIDIDFAQFYGVPMNALTQV